MYPGWRYNMLGEPECYNPKEFLKYKQIMNVIQRWDMHLERTMRQREQVMFEVKFLLPR